MWIAGSSIVKHAFARARNSFEGSQLDLNRQAASLWWQGRKSLRWCLVSGLIRTLLRHEEPPGLLVLHVGGNDLGQVPLGDLRLNVLLMSYVLCCQMQHLFNRKFYPYCIGDVKSTILQLRRPVKVLIRLLRP